MAQDITLDKAEVDKAEINKPKAAVFQKRRYRKLQREHVEEVCISIGTFVVLAIIWYVITKLKLVSDVLVPTPARVLKSLRTLIFEGYKGVPLLKHLTDSLYRLLSAYVLAGIFGIALGLASGYNRRIRAVFDPLVEFYQSLPPLAYYTLLIIWLGIENKSKITLLFLAAFASVYISSMSGVKAVREDYINGAYTLGAKKMQVFWHVIFPASLPYIFTGLRTSMAAAFGTLVAAEMVASVTGIGWMVFDASRFLRSDIIFAGLIVMGITSIVLDRTIRFAEKKIVPWKGKE